MGQPWRGKTGRKQTEKSNCKQWGKETPKINVRTPLDELDDDIDKFHKGSDKILLDGNDDAALSEDQMEDPIFNIKGESSEDEDDWESEDEDIDEEKLSGLAAKMAKQAKILRQKTTLVEDEGVEEEEEDGKENQALWGKRKRTYYSADNVDYELQSSDEEGLAEEENEALRLQRAQAELLRPEDFRIDGDVDAEPSLQGHSNTKQEERESQEAKDNHERGHDANKRHHLDRFAKGAKVFVEEVKKDLNALSKVEQMEVVMSDAPELIGLLADLSESFDELQNKVEPLLNKVKKEHFANNDGISFLESKHMLLLCYCQAIVFYLLMKAEGRSVRDHPVIVRLVEIRMLLDKFKPLDKRLHCQIYKLMSIVKESVVIDRDKEHLRGADEPNQKPGLQLGKKVKQAEFLDLSRGDEAEANSPKHYNDQFKGLAPEDGSASRTGRDLEDNFEKTTRVIAPESKEMLDERARLESRLQVNLEGFGTNALLKFGGQKLNIFNHLGNGSLNKLDDFDDEVADFVGIKEEAGGKLIKGVPSRKLSQIIAQAGQSKKIKIVSGDADLPVKEDLGERRARLEMRKASRVEHAEGELDDHVAAPLEEDEFYQKAKEKKAAKHTAKELKYSRIPDAALTVEEETGKRHISYQMEKNRGLTPHRKKLTKNPRKKYKVKHQKALIRRKGQVREIKLPTGPYGGESTGIRSSISKSVRFRS